MWPNKIWCYFDHVKFCTMPWFLCSNQRTGKSWLLWITYYLESTWNNLNSFNTQYQLSSIVCFKPQTNFVKDITNSLFLMLHQRLWSPILATVAIYNLFTVLKLRSYVRKYLLTFHNSKFLTTIACFRNQFFNLNLFAWLGYLIIGMRFNSHHVIDFVNARRERKPSFGKSAFVSVQRIFAIIYLLFLFPYKKYHNNLMIG